MKRDALDQRIEATQERLQDLRQRAGASLQPLGLLHEAIEELSSTLEELHVSLAAARGLVEAERQRYQELFDFAPDGYLVTDALGSIEEANSAAATLLHRRQDYLVHKPLIIFVARNQHQAFLDQLARLQSGTQQQQEWETRMQRHDGSVVQVGLTAATVHVPDGRLTGLRWSLRDITARKPFRLGPAGAHGGGALEDVSRAVGLSGQHLACDGAAHAASVTRRRRKTSRAS